jgi:hypothetical protein
MKTTISSFSALRDLGIRPAVIKQPEVVKPTIPNNNNNNNRPTYRPQVSPQEFIGQLAAIVDAIFTAKGFPNSLAFADNIIMCLMAEAQRKDPNLIKEKAPLRALETIIMNCSAGSDDNFFTRNKRLLRMLADTPAVDNTGNLVKIRGNELVDAKHVKEAVSCLTLYKAYTDLDDEFLCRLEVAKTTKIHSLRTPDLRKMRLTTPDIGCALLVAALQINGYTKNSMPIADLVRTNFPALMYMESVIKDLYRIIAEDNEFLRGENLCTFIEGQSLFPLDYYVKLANDYKSINVKDNMTADERKVVQDFIYTCDVDFVKNTIAQWKLLQRELDAIQQEALGICSNMLALIRHKKNEKEWYRQNDNRPRDETGKLIDNKKDKTKVVQPATKVEPKKSDFTPNEATAFVGEIDADINIPRFNISALDLSEVTRKKQLVNAGIDGARVCDAYPGVIWEAIMGPLDHIFDFDRSETECRMVVIAPRRVNGLGLDLDDARSLLVEDYESFFSPLID